MVSGAGAVLTHSQKGHRSMLLLSWPFMKMQVAIQESSQLPTLQESIDTTEAHLLNYSHFSMIEEGGKEMRFGGLAKILSEP